MGGKPRAGTRLRQLSDKLGSLWGHAECELAHHNAFELLIATILSAQSTDKRVNMVTPTLFAHYPTPRALGRARLEDVQEIIRSTGFFRQKAKNIVACSQQIAQHHGGHVPKTMAELVELPGVARKTANVVLGVAYGIAAGVVVDTHVKRLANRLGLSPYTNPVRVEQDLMRQFPKSDWIDLGHRLIWHGRRICHARIPNCQECPIAPLCPSFP